MPSAQFPISDHKSPHSFAIRGVIEGFYGPVWSMEQRIDLIRFIAKHNMNFYAYAPKGDPLCRQEWDRLLSPAELESFRILTEVASNLGISVAYGISPGISICYSSSDDRDRLLGRFKQLADAGLRHFMLLYDDLPPDVQHAADAHAYGSLVSAQADLTNSVANFLEAELPHVRLMVCPTVYCGRGDEAYICQLGAQIDPQVDIFWTGRTVWSSELDSRDARYFKENVGRQPLYWDNYPANDLLMSNEMHLGPYRGRDKDLCLFSHGVLVNPMRQPEASKIPLATIGDYLIDPLAYEPEESWNRAIEEVGGRRDAKAWRLFSDNVRSSCLELGESPLLTAALEKLRFAGRFGSAIAEKEEATVLVREFVWAANHLLGPDVENLVLAEELRPWLMEFRADATSILEAILECRLGIEPKVARPKLFSSLAIADLLPDTISRIRR